MKKRLITHLTANPSYLKWGTARLASKFNCSERTVKSVLKEIKEVKQAYLTSLKD